MATYGHTFTSGDTVTPTKLNNARTVSDIVNADIKSDAAIAYSKLNLANSITTGDITSDAVTTEKILNANVTQAKLASNVVGNGPAFRAFAGGTTALNNNTFTKVALSSETYDTNSNFASSIFTPTVAGYYLITGSINVTAGAEGLLALIYKNGTVITTYGVQSSAITYRASVSDIIYMNGTTDTIELGAYQFSGVNKTIASGTDSTFMSGCLIRS